MASKIIGFLKRGAATSKQLQIATGYSQAVLSRKLNNLGDRVVVLEKQRPPQYLLCSDAFGVGNRVPINLTNTEGEQFIAGFLRPIKPKGFYYESKEKTPTLLLGDNAGFFTGLPYYLGDLL